MLAFCSTAAATKLEVLHEFSGGDGSDPTGGLAFNPNKGTLYGTAQYGGTGDGTVFSLTPPAPGKKRWKFKVIYMFQGGLDGSRPQTGLVVDSLEKLHGTTRTGSSLCDCGTVFRLTENVDGSWEKELLHEFSGENFDGTIPSSAPFFDATQALLYGTTGAMAASPAPFFA